MQCMNESPNDQTQDIQTKNLNTNTYNTKSHNAGYDGASVWHPVIAIAS